MVISSPAARDGNMVPMYGHLWQWGNIRWDGSELVTESGLRRSARSGGGLGLHATTTTTTALGMDWMDWRSSTYLHGHVRYLMEPATGVRVSYLVLLYYCTTQIPTATESAPTLADIMSPLYYDHG